MVDLAQYKPLFLEEARGYVQKLNTLILALEKSPEDVSILNEMMATGHTFKGVAATMGYNHLAQLCHAIEDLFDFARKGQLKVTKDIIQTLFRAVDTMESAVAAIDKNNTDDLDEKISLDLRSVIQTDSGSSKPEKLEKKPQLKSQPEKKKKGTSEGSGGTGGGSAVDGSSARISVETKRLDVLMNLIEELTVERLKISHMSTLLGNSEFSMISRRLDRLVSDLQFHASRARMVPLEHIFLRFPRLVHDVAEDLKKKVQFEVSGAQVELDRTIVEALSEPLVHLIKNAIDHGIETPADREKAGKPSMGTLSISAAQERGIVRIIFRDDGSGIHWARVAKIAVSRGLIPDDMAKELMARTTREGYAPRELSDLLYLPDFSTKTEVTEISGRGVGLSVVRDHVDRMGGRVDIETTEGKGTSFIMEIPVTLALTNALVVRVGEELFAIPFASILRSVIVPAAEIKSFADGDVSIIDGMELPLLWMRKFYHLPTTATSYTVVIVGRAPFRAGLVIDQIVSEQEVVVKPFSPVLKTIQGFSGATILGDGRIALVVDVASLLEQSVFYGRAAS